MHDFIEESVFRINQAGLGSIFLADYVIFEEIIEAYVAQSVPFAEGINLMVEAAREIYWSENFDPGEESWVAITDRLVEAAPGRFKVN